MQGQWFRVSFGGWLAAIVALATAFRLYEIGLPDIWVDEANLILLASLPVDVLFERLGRDSSPPLFYLLVGAWSAVVGDSPVPLRLLSAIIGVVLVAATAWVGRDLWSAPAGLWAAFFLAVSPTQCFYSQQVRMYGLLALLALLSTAGLVRFLRDGRERDFALWVGASTLALYTHNFAFHLIPAQLLLIAVSGQLRARIGRWIVAGAVVSALYAPWVPSLLEQLGNRDHYAWFISFWEGWSVGNMVGNVFRSYSPSGEFQTYASLGILGRYGSLPTWGACALAGYGAWRCVDGVRARGVSGALWPLVWLVTPVATGLLLSFAMTPHFVPGRVDQMMFPAFALLCGIALAALPRGAGLAIALTILGLGAQAKFEMFDRYVDEPLDGNDRHLAEAVSEAWRPGDVIVCTSLSRASLEYYLGQLGRDARILSFPRSSAQHLGAQNDHALLEDKPGLLREAATVVRQARALAGAEGRIIVVWVYSEVNYPLRPAVMERRGLREVELLGIYRQFGTRHRIAVRLYEVADPP